MKELRVYILNYNDFDGEFENLSDEEIMDIAEESGSVYSLKGFEDAFNWYHQTGDVELNPDYNFIRFIEVEIQNENEK